jgi:AmiR/NasT family two-component response regulator
MTPAGKVPKLMSTRILIVLKDAAFAKGLADVVRAAGYEVDQVDLVHAGVVAAGASPPTLAVFDLGSAAEWLLGSHARICGESGIPFVLLSAPSTEAVAPEQVLELALAHATMPPDPRDCLVTIRVATTRAAELRGLRERERQMSEALRGSRTTSMATGILMERMRLDRARAFETLRSAARSRQRRIAELAAEVVGATEVCNGPWLSNGKANHIPRPAEHH